MYDNLRFEYAHFNSLDFGSYGLGASVSPMGSQLMTTNTAINWGMQNLEINLGTQMNFQQAGHLAQLGKIERDELIRLAKMNKVNLSVHAPHFCAAGGQGQTISDTARIKAIQEFRETLNFADQIGKGMNKKHVPVVIHSVEGVPGNPMPQEVMYTVNQETGQIIPFEKKIVTYDENYFKKYNLKRGVDYAPVKGKPGYFYLYPQGRLKMENTDRLKSLKHEEASLAHYRRIYENQLKNAGINLEQVRNNPQNVVKELLHSGRRDLVESIRIYQTMRDQEERAKQIISDWRKRYKDDKGNFNMFAPTDEFAKKQAKKTFVELGLEAYEKPTKPMIVIENFYPEHALSKPEVLAETIKEVREELAQRLVREKGLSRERAKQEAKQLIGMNLDIGHVNLWKRYGKKDKELLKEVEKASPYIKHVHITDNFGDYDAHLPVGWGNAPIKEFIESLRKRGWKGRAILETFGAIQYGGGGFGVAQSMYQMGLPLVPGGPSWEMAEGTYFQAGYAFTTGPILPDVNFQTYGVGFSGLPYATGAQIGGQKPGQKFSGTPMS